MKHAKKRSFDGLATAFVLTAAIAFMLCIYAPYELFLNNQFEFWMATGDLLLPSVVLFLAVCAVGAAGSFVLRLIGRGALRIGLAAGLALLIGLYIQGNLLVGGLPPLDGTVVDWRAASPERIKSLAVFGGAMIVAAVLAVFLRGKRFVKTVLYVSGALTLVLAVTLGTLFVTMGSRYKNNPLADKSGFLKPTTAGEFTYSTDRNLIVLMLDATDETIFAQELANDPELRAEMTGFTQFTDAMSGYPYTELSLPQIFSGNWFENGESERSFTSQSVKNSPFVKKAREQGYRIGLYDDEALQLPAAYHEGLYENQIRVKNRFSSLKGGCITLLRMTCIKYAPWDLKSHGYTAVRYSQKVKSSTTADGRTAEFFDWSLADFYHAVQKDGTVQTTGDKCLRFIQLEGAHVPYQYNKDVEVISTGATYQTNTQACLTTVKAYLKALKAAGVYENSAIAIMSDHGYDYSVGKDEKPDVLKRAHPMLMIKGIGESGELKTSDAAISYEDVAGALSALMDGKGALAAFDGHTAARERRFLAHEWTGQGVLTEYVTTGRADDRDAMRATGRVFTQK